MYFYTEIFPVCYYGKMSLLLTFQQCLFPDVISLVTPSY